MTREWLAAEVEHVIAWLLWGTGAGAAAICALHRDDIDLDARTITWRQDDSERVQPIPAALAAVLAGYLREVWPQLRIRDGRLLLNPHGQRRLGKTYLPREVQKLTRRLAQDAGIDHLPGRHTPTRWAKTYAKRILDTPTGSLITLLQLGRARLLGRPGARLRHHHPRDQRRHHRRRLPARLRRGRPTAAGAAGRLRPRPPDIQVPAGSAAGLDCVAVAGSHRRAHNRSRTGGLHPTKEPPCLSTIAPPCPCSAPPAVPAADERGRPPAGTHIHRSRRRAPVGSRSRSRSTRRPKAWRPPAGTLLSVDPLAGVLPDVFDSKGDHKFLTRLGAKGWRTESRAVAVSELYTFADWLARTARAPPCWTPPRPRSPPTATT